ncbi:MAG: hypothetical protein AB7I41_01615 [Candidatus Sericytochromatia bacterium]
MSTKAERKEIWESFVNKRPYTGPIEFVINTTLLDASYPNARRVNLTEQLNPQGFHTQALPQGPVHRP